MVSDALQLQVLYNKGSHIFLAYVNWEYNYIYVLHPQSQLEFAEAIKLVLSANNRGFVLFIPKRRIVGAKQKE